MPSTITPPSIAVKDTLAVPRTSYLPTRTEEAAIKRKIICFSDFDGTIFMQDTGHILFDAHGCGSKRRAILDEQIKTGERSFREVSEEMWGSLNVPFDDGFEVMEKELEIDPDFRAFHKFCIENDIPFNVISAGLKPILRKVLDTFLGEEESSQIDIVANDASIAADGSDWKPLWLHPTPLGHDKALSITQARQTLTSASPPHHPPPLIVFIGDGVSDLPAAREADILFARRGLALETYCIANKIPHVPFETFAHVQQEVQAVMREDEKRTGGRGLPVRFNPRANLWRRVSAREAARVYVAMTPSREEKMFLWPEEFSELKGGKDVGTASTKAAAAAAVDAGGVESVAVMA